jgi:hypothetical protein
MAQQPTSELDLVVLAFDRIPLDEQLMSLAEAIRQQLKRIGEGTERQSHPALRTGRSLAQGWVRVECERSTQEFMSVVEAFGLKSAMFADLKIVPSAATCWQLLPSRCGLVRK